MRGLWQRGMSLIELMVAMVIGLIILAGLSQIFVSGRTAYTLQERVGDLQENGRFAIGFLDRSLRMAGYPQASATITAFQSVITPATCDNCGENGTDVVSICYMATQASFDCTGTAVAQNDPPRQVVRETYFIQRGADGVSRLMCRARPLPVNLTDTANPCGQDAGTLQTQPLVDGIENLQVLYGIDTDTDPEAAGAGFPNQYVKASGVTDWEEVVAVRVALLASTIGDIAQDESGTSDLKTFTLLDETKVAIVDGPGNKLPKVRGGVFSATVEVRNRSSIR
jgi:type IV pilus assembly protein PilW